MIYMEPVSLGWECLVTSWINQLSPLLYSVHKIMLHNLILRLTRALLFLVRRCNVTVSTYNRIIKNNL